jgi:hypothetical protein
MVAILGNLLLPLFYIHYLLNLIYSIVNPINNGLTMDYIGISIIFE